MRSSTIFPFPIKRSADKSDVPFCFTSIVGRDSLEALNNFQISTNYSHVQKIGIRLGPSTFFWLILVHRFHGIHPWKEHTLDIQQIIKVSPMSIITCHELILNLSGEYHNKCSQPPNIGFVDKYNILYKKSDENLLIQLINLIYRHPLRNI